MIRKVNQFIYRGDGTYVDKNATEILALNNYSNIIQFISAVDSENSIIANIQLNNLNKTVKQQYMSLVKDANGIRLTGKDVIDSQHPYFQLVKDYNVWEMEIGEGTLATISRAKSSSVGLIFSIREKVQGPEAVNYKGTFGSIRSTLKGDLPLTAEAGDYYTLDLMEFNSATADKVFNYGEFVFYDGAEWLLATEYILIANTVNQPLAVSSATNGTSIDKVDSSITETILVDLAKHDSELSDLTNTVLSWKDSIVQIQGSPLSELDLLMLMVNLDDDLYKITTEKNGNELLHISDMYLPVEGQEELEDPELELVKEYSRRLANGTSFRFNQVIQDWELAAGGGSGGGGGSNAQVRIRPFPANSSLNFQHAVGAQLVFQYEYLHSEDSAASVQYFRNGVLFKTESIIPGVHSIDLTNKLTVGTNTFLIKAIDYENVERNLTVIIEGVTITVSSSFVDSSINTTTFDFPYKVSAIGFKQAFFIVDGGEPVFATITAENNIKSFTLTHGAHIIEFYAKTIIGDTTLTSPTLRFTALVNDGISNSTILASKFNLTEINQGNLIAIDYVAFRRNNETTPVSLYIDNELVGSLTVGRARQFWNVRNLEIGNHVLKIQASEAVKEFNIEIIELDIEIESIDDAFLKTYLTANGKTNQSMERDQWINSAINGQTYGFEMNNFNYASNGWIDDSLVFNGNAQAVLDFKPFATEVGASGYTIEIEFKAPATADETINLIECFANDRGFEIKANQALFKGNNNRVDVFYKEGERIKLSFVISKSRSIIFTYLNGVLSGQDFILSTTRFSQGVQAQPIKFNLNHEGLIVYSFRAYARELTDREVLKNYIYDLPSIDDKINDYNGSLIYNASGVVDIEKVKTLIPVMTISLNRDFPQLEDDRPFINSMNYENPWDPSLNFVRNNVQMRTQGTSTLQYPVKNYRFYNGDLKSNPVKLTDGTRPAQILNIKTDYVDSSLSTNVVIAKMIEDMYVNGTRPQVEKPELQTRTTIYGDTVAVFHNENGNITFRGLYNLNNDKSEPAIFGHDASFGYPDSQRFETLFNAGDNAVAFKRRPELNDAQWLQEVKDGFESIYPKEDLSDDNYKDLEEFISYIADADIEAMDETELADYKAELSERLDTDFALKYYLVSSMFGLVDGFGKDLLLNTWGFEDDNAFKKWYLTFYDLDTAVGIDNQGRFQDAAGNMLYDYNIELEDGSSFAQAESKLWDTVIELYKDEIKALYKTMRTEYFTKDFIMTRFFDEHINLISRALYNVNGLYKYVDAVGASVWSLMLNGNREFQLKRWIENRLAFLDSKYVAGTDASQNIIAFRLAAPDMSLVSVGVIPTIHQYASIEYGNSAARLVQEKVLAGELATLPSPLSGAVSGLECQILAADKVEEVVGLGELDIETLSFVNATNLRRINLGSETDNTSLTSLIFSNNTLLEEIDIRNLKSLSGGLNLSTLVNLKKLNASGSSITAIDLPNGGVLEELTIPATITSLELVNQTYLQADKLVIEGLSTLQTIWIENSPVPSLQLILDTPNLTNVRIMDLTFSTNQKQLLLDVADVIHDGTNFIIGGLDDVGGITADPVIYGEVRIYATTDYTPTEYDRLAEAFPNLVIEVIAPTVGLTFTDMGEYFEVAGYSDSKTSLTIPIGFNGDLESLDPVYQYSFDGWKQVKGIGEAAFRFNTTLQNLTLPEGIEYIGDYAFDGATKLRPIVFESSLKTIGEYAFRGDQYFDIIYIPETVITIGKGAFSLNDIADGDNLITAYASKPAGWDNEWVDGTYTVTWNKPLIVRTFTFNTSGGSYIAPVVGYVLNNLPVNPTKQGSDFVKWLYNGEDLTLPLIPEVTDPSTLTIDATWSDWTYNIRYYKYNDAGVRTLYNTEYTIGYDVAFGAGRIPMSPGNSTALGIFKGWKTSDSTIVTKDYKETRNLSSNSWNLDIDAYYLDTAGLVFVYDAIGDVYDVTKWDAPFDHYIYENGHYNIFIPATFNNGTNGEKNVRNITIYDNNSQKRDKLGSLEVEDGINGVFKLCTTSSSANVYKYLKSIKIPSTMTIGNLTGAGYGGDGSVVLDYIFSQNEINLNNLMYSKFNSINTGTSKILDLGYFYNILIKKIIIGTELNQIKKNLQQGAFDNMADLRFEIDGINDYFETSNGGKILYGYDTSSVFRPLFITDKLVGEDIIVPVKCTSVEPYFSISTSSVEYYERISKSTVNSIYIHENIVKPLSVSSSITSSFMFSNMIKPSNYVIDNLNTKYKFSNGGLYIYNKTKLLSVIKTFDITDLDTSCQEIYATALDFVNFSGSTEISIPSNITLQGFSNTNATKLTIDSNNRIINAMYLENNLNLIETIFTGTLYDSSYTYFPLFKGCTALESVTFINGFIIMNNDTFSNCSSLISITLPYGTTSIGNDAFYNCSSLTSITLPDSTTSIGNSVFIGCSSLTSITIPSNVTSIGTYTFSNCLSLSTIILQPSTPPTVATSSFNNIASTKTFYVPVGKLTDYQTATNWTAYAADMEEVA